MTPPELKSWREAKGLSQRDLADILAVSRFTVSRWEKTHVPKLVVLAIKGMEHNVTEDMVDRYIVAAETELADPHMGYHSDDICKCLVVRAGLEAALNGYPLSRLYPNV